MVHKNLELARKELAKAQEADPTFSKLEVHAQAKEEVQKWLGKEEIMWHQRVKAMWLQAGDQNSKYFHSKASHKRKNNFIRWLLDENSARK